jgi:hypothetical protein
MRIILLCTFFTATLAAAGVTGKWRGTITTEIASQTTGGQIPAFMILEQSDGKVTGSAGGSEKQLFKIRLGAIRGDRLTVEASPKDHAVLRFNLVLKGDVIEGEVEENGRAIGTAKLTREP